MLDPTKIANLVAVVNLPGYAVVLEIFDAKIKNLEGAVFEINPTNADEVVAAHRVAVGARWAFDEMRKHIARITAEPAHVPKPMTRAEEEELYLKSLQ